MDQYLDIEQRIRLSVKIGESSVREFKSALQGRPGEKQPRSAKDIMTDVACTLVAFANSDGGELLIGVEDNGQITGVPHDENTINTILDATESHIHQDTPLPIPRKGIVYIDNKVVIYFSLSKGTRYVHLTRDGRCLKRLDRESVPVSSEEIRARRFEDGSREWDRQIAGGATLADLDLDLLEEISNQITPGVSIEKSLQYLELAEFSHDGLVLKNAAMVLFAKNIGKWHPGCSVRILHVDGREQRSGSQFNVKAEPIIQSNILRLQDSSWQRLNLALSQKPKFTENAQFQQTFLYPQTASREALINAIVHRNYLIQRGIEIYIYSDRMEIISPGMLLSTVSIDDLVKLTGIHESRNPLIARVLREMGLVREMGEGIRRIYDVMRSSSLAEPHLSNDTTGFTVTLYHKSMYDPRVRLWLSEFEENYKLTENQKAILALGFDNQ
ncbi:MAG: ATP-binding protein, partial [Chloroflexota bacterium]